MMTAEQFIEERLVPPLLHGDEPHQEWLRSELRKWIPDLAAQLAEKEREIARLTKQLENCGGDNCFGQTVVGCRSWVSKERLEKEQTRAEAAEQRLQEAQAQITAGEQFGAKILAECQDLRERLRQREAELEQALALLRDLPLDRFGDDMGKHDAADFVDHAGYFFDVMFRAKKLLAPAPPKEGASS